MESRDLSIEGVDGSVWPLYGLRAYGRDVAIIADGLDLGDLYMPPTEIITSAAAFQVGATPRKVRQDRRLIPMTVGTKGASIRGHDRVEEQWWQAFAGAGDFRPSQLVSNSSGVRRWLDVLLSSSRTTTATGLGADAFGNNYLEHTLDLLACNPAWQGGTRTKTASGSGVLTFPISNPTDRPMWLQIVGSAGSCAIQDGLSDRMVPIPPMTQGWKVYTNPQQPTLEVDEGVSGWPHNMEGVTFTKPIPPGTFGATLDVACAGPMEIMVEMVDQYSRPWG